MLGSMNYAHISRLLTNVYDHELSVDQILCVMHCGFEIRREWQTLKQVLEKGLAEMCANF